MEANIYAVHKNQFSDAEKIMVKEAVNSALMVGIEYGYVVGVYDEEDGALIEVRTGKAPPEWFMNSGYFWRYLSLNDFLIEWGE